MGEDISRHQFDEGAIARFGERLRAETDRLCGWIDNGEFGDGEVTCGNELEGWLVDSRFRATTANGRYLEALGMPEAVPELARFNIEFNGRPKQVPGHGLAAMHAELLRWLNRGAAVAEQQGLNLVFIGSLPTLCESDINVANITLTNRYKALDEMLARYRGAPEAEIEIEGRGGRYRRRFDSIMIESATTSFQLHLQVPGSDAVAWYNAAVAATAPVLAMAANSPYLFGHDLWAENRIPVFMQSVNSRELNSVTFGNGYLERSWSEFFRNNLDYPVLLPECFADDDETLPHLRLHNSTVWRWNRPVIDIENRRLRIEHRALPAGPTVVDMVANCALFFGLVAELAAADTPVTELLPFQQAEANFFAAAPVQPGIDAVARGLRRLDVDRHEAEEYLEIVRERAVRRVNGAQWQRAFVRRHGEDPEALVAAYSEQQLRGRPVAQWPT